MKSLPYLSKLATMMYVANWSLPHLSFVTTHLGQFMHDPSPLANEMIDDVIVFAYAHRNATIIKYAPSPSVPSRYPSQQRTAFHEMYGLHGWTDASWQLRSIGGLILFLAGGPVDWGAKLIRVICHSSAEAEIGAACRAGKRSVFITEFLAQFKITSKHPVVMFVDNSAAIDLSNKLGVGTRTAHFLRWQHYFRYLVLHQFVLPIFVTTKEQLADIMTKVLDISTTTSAMNVLYG